MSQSTSVTTSFTMLLTTALIIARLGFVSETLAETTHNQAYIKAINTTINAADHATDDSESQEEITQRIKQNFSNRSDASFGDLTMRMNMILRNKKGRESFREIQMKSIEGTHGQGDKSLALFVAPRDQKGTAMLTHQHRDKDDEQWIFLPSAKRVKKIASSKKSGAFFGSEFSFEDIGGVELDDYDVNYLRDEEIDGVPYHVVERTPKDPYSGYSKMIDWIDQEKYFPVKTNFFNRKAEYFKTMTYQGWKEYKKDLWQPESMTMHNSLTGKSTVIQFSEIQFDNGLSVSEFTTNSLKRAR